MPDIINFKESEVDMTSSGYGHVTFVKTDERPATPVDFIRYLKHAQPNLTVKVFIKQKGSIRDSVGGYCPIGNDDMSRNRTPVDGYPDIINDDYGYSGFPEALSGQITDEPIIGFYDYVHDAWGEEQYAHAIEILIEIQPDTVKLKKPTLYYELTVSDRNMHGKLMLAIVGKDFYKATHRLPYDTPQDREPIWVPDSYAYSYQAEIQDILEDAGHGTYEDGFIVPETTPEYVIQTLESAGFNMKLSPVRLCDPTDTSKFRKKNKKYINKQFRKIKKATKELVKGSGIDKNRIWNLLPIENKFKLIGILPFDEVMDTSFQHFLTMPGFEMELMVFATYGKHVLCMGFRRDCRLSPPMTIAEVSLHRNCLETKPTLHAVQNEFTASVSQNEYLDFRTDKFRNDLYNLYHTIQNHVI